MQSVASQAKMSLQAGVGDGWDPAAAHIRRLKLSELLRSSSAVYNNLDPVSLKLLFSQFAAVL